MLVSFGAVSTDIYFLVPGVLILTLRSYFQPGTVLPNYRHLMTTVLVNPVLPLLSLLTLVIRFTTLEVVMDKILSLMLVWVLQHRNPAPVPSVRKTYSYLVKHSEERSKARRNQA